MSAPLDPGLLYTALMLRKLHELRCFGCVLDAGDAGRYRAVLAEHLPGAAWIGTGEAWAPVLDGLRLCRRGESLGLTDIRPLAASRLPGVDLALFDEGLGSPEPAALQALVNAWVERAALVLIALPAAVPLTGALTRFVAGGTAVCFFSAGTGRARQVLQLHGVIPGIVQHMTGQHMTGQHMTGQPTAGQGGAGQRAAGRA